MTQRRIALAYVRVVGIRRLATGAMGGTDGYRAQGLGARECGTRQSLGRNSTRTRVKPWGHNDCLTPIVLAVRRQGTRRRRTSAFAAQWTICSRAVEILDRDLRYRYLNQAAEIHNRRPNEELLGQHYVESWPGIEATEVYRRIVDCLALRCADHMEHEFTYPDGKVGWFELRLEPVPDGLLIMSVDITEHKLTQARLRHVNNVLRATSEVNQLIVREKDSVKLAQGACDILVNTRSYRAVWIVVDDGVAVPTVAQTGWAEEFVEL